MHRSAAPPPRLASLVLVAALALGCDRGSSGSEASSSTSPAALTAPVEPEPVPRWASTCLESIELQAPPPPPPPLMPEDDEIEMILRDAALPLSPAAAPATSERVATLPEQLVRARTRDNLARRIGIDAATCDVEALVRRHDAAPTDESLYCAIAFAYDVCKQPEQAMAWTKRRVDDFPASQDARLALALRRLFPLVPDPSSGRAFNESIPAAERAAIATTAITELEALVTQRPDHRRTLAAAALAYTLRASGREWIASIETPEQLLDLVHQQRDLTGAWRHARALALLEGQKDCE